MYTHYRIRLAVVAAGLLLTSVACATNPQPQTGVVYVRRGPPRPRVEVIEVAPSPAHVWIGGHWGWQEREYVWVPGRWERPAAEYREWVPGRWARDRQGWFWIEGRWK